MLTPIEAARKAIDAVTVDTNYSSTSQKKLVLPFFRSWKAQAIVCAWMEYAVPLILAGKTKEEAEEMVVLMKGFDESNEKSADLNPFFQNNASALYTAADVFLSAYALICPMMLRYEELTVENKRHPESKAKQLFDESAGFFKWFAENKSAKALVDPVLAGRMVYINRASLKSAPILKARADDMLESLLRMKENITDYEVNRGEIESGFRLSVASRISAAIVSIDMVQKNADWMYELSREVIRAKGQYKRLMGREKVSGITAGNLSKEEATMPASSERVAFLTGVLFDVAEKAAMPQKKAEPFFFA